MAEPLSPAAFAAKIRARFPGEYDDLTDDDLTNRVLTKHPEYKDMVGVPRAGQSQDAPQSLADRARARLAAWGTSAREVRDRAAAGQETPAPLFVEPTPYEAAASSAAGLAAGTGRGLASLLTIPADAATDLYTAGPVRRGLTEARERLNRLRTGRPEQMAAALGSEPLTDMRIPMPRTELATAAAEDAKQTFKGWMSVRPNAITDVGEMGNELAGEILAPGPEVAAELRAGMNPRLPRPRAGELVETAARREALDEATAWADAQGNSAIRTADGELHLGDDHRAIRERLGMKAEPAPGADIPTAAIDPANSGWVVRGEFISAKDLEATQGSLSAAYNRRIAGPKPLSAAALRETFNLTDEEATATEALVDAMGLDKSRIALEAGGTPADGALAQRGRNWYYDNVEESLKSWQAKGTPEQLAAHLKKVKGAAEEAETIGLNEWLAGKKSVTREEVQSFLDENRIDVQEVVKTGADTQYEKYTLRGGENYRELLLTLPEREGVRPYHNSHFKEPNVLAHVRLTDHSIEGRRTLVVEEVQSDWHQEGRRMGYTQPNDPPSVYAEEMAALGLHERPPDAPFKGDGWKKLAVKRVVAYAAENGYDSIAWPVGDAQAARFGLKVSPESIVWRPGREKLRTIELIVPRTGDAPEVVRLTVNDDGQITGTTQSDQQWLYRDVKDILPEDVVRAVYSRAAGRVDYLPGDQPVLGGGGMRGFYDVELPAVFKDALKKFGGAKPRRVATEQLVEVFDARTGEFVDEFTSRAQAEEFIRANPSRELDLEDVPMSVAADQDVHLIDLPEDARRAIKEQGLPLFQGEKGAVEFTKGGQAIIRALKEPDVSTAVHEIAHTARRFLFDRNIAPEQRLGITDADIQTAERWAGASGGKWSVTAEERFARGFERYLRDGVAPTEALGNVFAKFKAWLTRIYETLVGSPLNVEISPSMREVFDRLVSRGPQEGAAAADTIAPGTLNQAAPRRQFGLYTRLREAVDDDWRRVKELVDDPKTVVTPESDPYTAEILSHGRIATRLEEVRDAVVAIDKDIVRTGRAAGVPDVRFREDIDAFLHARHAPERNAALQSEDAAGITDADARDVLDRIAASPHGQEVVRIADQLQELNSRTLDVLREGGLITEELHAALRAKYQHHVPLNRIMDDVDDVGPVIAGRPMDVRSTGIRAARGSQRAISDITTNIVTNYEQAIIRAEKNRVNLAALQFARDNPELGLFSESRPRAIGFRFDGETPIMKPRANDPQVLVLYEDGRAVDLKINDRGLAAAMKGLNRLKADGVLRVIQAYTRTVSNLATRFNPEFFAPNKLRDLQEAMIYAFSKEKVGAAGAAKIVGRDAASMKDVLDFVRGKETDGTRLYQQMRRDGGTTGGLGLSTREAIQVDIDDIRRLNRSRPRMVARQIVKFVDALNQVFEDSTRLSVYKTALERGLGRPQAARLAKEASINFNKFGKFGPQVNALYMFANASIQGTAKMARAMKNPKVAGVVTAAVGTAVAATAEWNDRMDPEWRTRVSKVDRAMALVVMLPPSDNGAVNYLKIPVSWGIKPIKVAMDFASDAMAGKSDVTPGQAVAATAVAAFESVNPVGGTDVVSAMTPTAGDLPVDLARNRAWHGGAIGPDPAWDDTMPESERYFRNLPNTLTGELAIEATEELSERGIEISPANLKYAIDTLGGGSGRFATKVINTLTSIGKGEAPDVNEVPVVNRFVEQVSPERLTAQNIAQQREMARTAEREARRQARQRQLQGK